MAHSSRQASDHIVRMAALHTPRQLKNKAMILIAAFLFQHECIACEIRASQVEATEDAAETRAAVMADLQSMLCAVIADGTTLSIIHDLLAQIDGDFDRASPPTIKAVVDQMHAALDDDDCRSRLEHLFKHPITPSSDELIN